MKNSVFDDLVIIFTYPKEANVVQNPLPHAFLAKNLIKLKVQDQCPCNAHELLEKYI